MSHRVSRLPEVKRCFTKPVLRSSFVAAHLASLPRQDRRARRLFLLLYYAVCAQCLAAAIVVNFCLISGHGGNLKYYALLALLLSMGVSIICSTRYEKRHHAAHEKMQRESPFRDLE